MHYGDKEQLEQAILSCVIYKHEIGGVEEKRNKNGLTSKTTIHYELASIQKCKYFNPRLLLKIINDPYKYFVKFIDKYPNEEWLLLTVKDLNGWDKIEVINVTNVSYNIDITKLH